MSTSIKSIRTQLGLTQAAFAEGIGVTQGNVSHYENNGQTVMPDVARRVIELVNRNGFACTFDDVYSEEPVLAPLPRIAAPAKPAEPATLEG